MTSLRRTLFVTGFSPSTSAEELKRDFLRFGQVSRCDIIPARSTRTSRMYAFIDFYKPEDAAFALRSISSGKRVPGSEPESVWKRRTGSDSGTDIEIVTDIGKNITRRWAKIDIATAWEMRTGREMVTGIDIETRIWIEDEVGLMMTETATEQSTETEGAPRQSTAAEQAATPTSIIIQPPRRSDRSANGW
ncbi:hypothetical protein C8J56DRAFT_1025496 [Mycena floridula]|nr:hypothetical protein C8J56DRAFT_1025496 [Mycena floridula]